MTMISGLLKLIGVVVVVAIVAAFLLGYDIRDFRGVDIDGPRDVIGTTGGDVRGEAREAGQEAREAGAEVREETAQAADATRRAIADGALTSKIKAKMALDDTVSALSIDVDTDNGMVTLTGRINSEAERQRALALARETKGVTQVVDRLAIK
jgi:hyperosmotically inducible protein